MGIPKHGRCRRGIRPALGSIGRPQAGLKGETNMGKVPFPFTGGPTSVPLKNQ